MLNELDYVLLAGRYSLLDQSAGLEFLPFIQEQSAELILGGVYGSGILAAGSKSGALYDYKPADKDIICQVRQIEKHCDEHLISIGAAALNFVLAHQATGAVLCGLQSVDHVRETLAWSQTKIPQAFWDAI